MTSNTLDKYSMLSMLTDDLQELQNKHNALTREHDHQLATVDRLKVQLEGAHSKSHQLEYRLSAARNEQHMQMGKLLTLKQIVSEIMEGEK